MGTGHFPETERKASILNAVEQHDCGWAEFDEALVLDTGHGSLAGLYRSSRCGEARHVISRDRASRVRSICCSARSPASVARVSALYRGSRVVRVLRGDDRNSRFVLRAARVESLDEMLHDYRLLRAGDLASLAFCNEWADTADDGCGYSMQWDGTTLTINPDPLDGRTIDIDIKARVISDQRFAAPAEARRAVAAAQVITVTGVVGGAER